MKIFDLKEMEVIVESCPSLKWDGWNVMLLEEDPMAYMNKDAIFVEDKWHKKTTYLFNKDHWYIPKNILRNKCA